MITTVSMGTTSNEVLNSALKKFLSGFKSCNVLLPTQNTIQYNTNTICIIWGIDPGCFEAKICRGLSHSLGYLYIQIGLCMKLMIVLFQKKNVLS